MKTTIRVKKLDDTWLTLDCIIRPEYGEIEIPEWSGVWAIHSTGMVGNIGGNDWRIYTLHPDDCAAIFRLAGWNTVVA